MTSCVVGAEEGKKGGVRLPGAMVVVTVMAVAVIEGEELQEQPLLLSLDCVLGPFFRFRERLGVVVKSRLRRPNSMQRH